MDLGELNEGEADQPEVALLVFVDIKPESMADFLKVMEGDARGSRDRSLDPGAIRFDMLRSTEVSNRFLFYEVYRDAKSVSLHKTTDHYKAWSAFKEVGVEKQSVTRLTAASIPGAWAFQTRSPCPGSAPGIAVVVFVEIDEERVEEFLSVMHQDAVGSRGSEPGCIRFDLLRDPEKANKFVFYECYSDDKAVQHHRTTAHYKAWADFKATGAVKSQEVFRYEAASIPGGWAFQTSKEGPGF